MTDMIILPGIGGSGDTHWQTLWQAGDPQMLRFRPGDWNRPECKDWISALDRAIRCAAHLPVLIAHSLSCLLVAHWQCASSLPIAGAFLVAVPDPESAAFPAEAVSFADPPTNRFRFPTLIVTSTNDPFGSMDYAYKRARQWGSNVVEIGPLGHVNGASGLGDWPQGKSLLTAFTAGMASS